MKKVMLAGKQVNFRTKISNSKKQLARIISENGGWREGASYAAQDKTDMRVDSYTEKPWIDKGQTNWNGNYTVAHKFYAKTLLSDWHQTVLARDEYFHLYPAPDAGVKVVTKPERIVIEPEPTIEQLAADYRAKLAIAQQAQEEADSHRCGAEAALEKLVAAGKALGLVLGVAAPEAELVITDWRDLQAGDCVECVQTPFGANCKPGMVGVVTETTAGGVRARFDASLSGRADGSWFSTHGACYKFVRRPAKGADNA